MNSHTKAPAFIGSSRNRRRFLATMGVGAFLARPDLFAQEATLTPAQTIGPYYPDKLPLDLDNDLIRINDNMSTALGEVSWVSGRLMDEPRNSDSRSIG
jgi:protocatechuate 3,4-dioxygenase, beta subunit